LHGLPETLRAEVNGLDASAAQDSVGPQLLRYLRDVCADKILV
jgi:hypothetical protein